MRKKRHSSIWVRFIAGVMLLWFMCMSFSQAFHHHAQQGLVSADASGEQQYVTAVELCKICDFIAHTRHDIAALIYWLKLSAALPKAVDVSSGVYARIYKFTLQGFSNKGPPACFSPAG